MMIHYKLIEHERFEDAPFIGALISACDCRFNCKNCFNQHIKSLPVKCDTSEHIIEIIKENPFNKGIIFAGLEWFLQIDEAIALAKLARENGLKTILYTGNEYLIPYIAKNFDYVKCGRYKEEFKTDNHIEYGVTLATSNQHIYKNGINY